uniref:Uncharacterized protein n=1 Tax=Moschus moschiferus TaxID=68415 RepID=A0A8C6E3L5_MOSMO
HEEVNPHSNIGEFTEGSEINVSKDQQDDGKILNILNFLRIQKHMKEEDFALLHIQTRSQ